MKYFLILTILFFKCISIFAQDVIVDTVDPPNWWAGMKNQSLQIMVHGQNLQNCKVQITYQGIKIKNYFSADNPEYLFINLALDKSVKAGKFSIQFLNTNKNQGYSLAYELKKRENNSSQHQGISSADLIYLIMTDRFCNGDTSNDFISSMQEKYFSRDSSMSRHGGDLQGVISKLDYLKELGTTALWLTPFFENNQNFASYHGYAITDYYKVDPRLGSNELYKKMVQTTHDKGMKVIMDLVFNHIGNNHRLYKNLPSKNWVHYWDEFTMSNFRDVTMMDPYASESDKKKFSNGWFDKHMPDLNQDDSLLSKYLIQNTIWWIEFSGIDGIRLDTYAYPSQKFMTDWTTSIKNEYPDLGIFAETWVSGLANQAYYTKNSGLKNPYKPVLPGVTDFQLQYAINNALTKDFGWTDGVSALYYCLANDYLYEDPSRNVAFLDNHDLSRFYSVIGEDIDKFKMGITFLLTTRGIPCLYYGTEILMKNFADKHEHVRLDFPGGWKTDKTDKFTITGRNNIENTAFDYIKKLTTYRKANTVFQTGKLMQFVPENGVYVYFRYNDKKTIMIILNQNKEKQEIPTKKFSERLKGFTKARNIMNEEKITDLNKIIMPGKCALIMELE